MPDHPVDSRSLPRCVARAAVAQRLHKYDPEASPRGA
jgi:hypothetical protein